MFDLILVALLQAVAGDPAQPAETAQQTSEAPATAAQTEAAPQQTPSEAEPVRCRREPIVGTRLSRRVCTTAAQDAAMREDARQMVNRGQMQGASRAD